ncbi:MAG: phage portal protein [Kiritimatiellae bacterium]|nr:phage portal protein [Kiritimatiellia bacterium]
MKLWPFSKRSNGSVSWSSLSDAQRRLVARKIAGAAMELGARAHFGKGYEAVTLPFSEQRRPSYIETKGEDGQLSARDRNRIVNLHRDMMRNSPTRVAQDQQIRVNVVGSVGGKMYASFPPAFASAANKVMEYFNKTWFPRAEFTFRKNFNWLLKTVLTAEDTNGNVILVFDDGILTGGNGTGRIRGFEGDEIGNVPELEKFFPKGFVQSHGLVYNKSGMFTGAFVSTVQREKIQRGKGTLDPKLGVVVLKQDQFADDQLVNWILLGDMRRFNQGRAVSPITAAITCLIDLHETCASEAQAAKINAQLVGQILSDASADEDTSGAAAFEDERPDGKALPETKEFTTKELTAIGAHFDQMPPGLKIDLLRTERPNPNMPAYIEFLTGLVGGTRGLARVYATLKAQTSYTAFRGEQVMTAPSFEEARADLEREVCDWAAQCVITRAVRLGLITDALPDGWEHMIAWRWPKMREVSEKDAQTALKLKFENGVTSLSRELGPGEVEKIIAERAAEKAKFEAVGLAYPGEAKEKDPAVKTVPEDGSEGETEDDNNGGKNADEE